VIEKLERAPRRNKEKIYARGVKKFMQFFRIKDLNEFIAGVKDERIDIDALCKEFIANVSSQYNWKLASSWGVALAKWLEANNIKFAEPLSAEYTLVTVKHNPIYDASIHTSYIYVTAKSTSGIKSITLTIKKGKMVAPEELGYPPSVIPLRADAVTFSKTWKYPNKPKEISCVYSEKFGMQALITYQAEVIPVSGTSVKSETITFAAGNPKQPGYKYEPTDIRPVFWHHLEPMEAKINLCFFPNFDYHGAYKDFCDDLRKIIYWAFFNYDPNNTFGKVYTANRHHFNLWTAPFGVNASHSMKVSYDSVVKPIHALMDGSVIVHLREGWTWNDSDWGTISSGGGTGTTASPKLIGGAAAIFTHESGHFLHKLSDEYCCHGGYLPYPTTINVFKSKSDCENFAIANKIPYKGGPRWIQEYKKVGIWHINRPGEIMGCTGSSYSSQEDWYNCSRYGVLNRFAKCKKGKCY